MSTLTEMRRSAPLEPLSPNDIAVSKAFVPVALPGPQVAGNDAAYDEALDREHELDAWARRAFASNGFGDAATGARFSSYEIFLAARTLRAIVLGEIVATAFRALSGLAQRAYAYYRQRRRASEIYDTLRQLDDSTLRDLGFDRSELRRVAEETAARSALAEIGAAR
jgi:uncharacterized protein YjiS (DUF1127 family)